MNYQTLHRESLVIDTHCDTILRVIRSDGSYRLRDAHEEGHVDVPRLRQGGVNLQFFAAYIEPQYKPDRSVRRVLQMFDCFYQEIAANPDDLYQVLCAADLTEARRQGKIGALLAIEGGEAIEGDLGVLRMLHRLGARCMSLTWNQRNQLADGAWDCRSGGGLTQLGVDLVQEMNRLGMIVDVSHLSIPGFWDVVDVSTKPIIASHSNARAVCDHIRNLNDEQIKALAKNGGVMGLNMDSSFLCTGEQATIEHVVDHAMHICELVGSKHLGIGADFDGISRPPIGLENVSKLPSLTEALLKRGLSDEQVRDILGENYLRVIKTTLG